MKTRFPPVDQVADPQPQPSTIEAADIAIIGAGPAGLMVADQLSERGHAVTIFDAMATPGRKLLIAGRGGLNLTHSEPMATFLMRYGADAARFKRFLHVFSPSELRGWADALGADTFIGSSGRIFPRAMKASGLLRAWLARLAAKAVTLRVRHRWLGWQGDDLLFRTDDGICHLIRAKATILALGGASWPKLGSDGAWQVWLRDKHIPVKELVASNCGIDISWSSYFRAHFGGQPLKSVTAEIAGDCRRGEVIVTDYGLEGGPIYALSPVIRSALKGNEPVFLTLDLKPDLSLNQLAERLMERRHGQSLSQYLKKSLHLPAPGYALLREVPDGEIPEEPLALARRLKRLTLPIHAMRPVEQAISSAGGIAFEALDDHLMLKNLPGVFACGEMLDWEAPTGGYLLQGCFATAVIAAAGVDRFLQGQLEGKM